MFEKIDEAFICENCGNEVKPLGYTSRDHCPKCLVSKHVDIVPGDRSEKCHGHLIPIGVVNNARKGYTIIYRCEKCGVEKRNKVATDDNFDLLLEIAQRSSYNTF